MWRCRFHARLALPPGQPSCPQGISGSPLHTSSGVAWRGVAWGWRAVTNSNLLALRELGLGLEGVALRRSILGQEEEEMRTQRHSSSSSLVVVAYVFWEGQGTEEVLCCAQEDAASSKGLLSGLDCAPLKTHGPTAPELLLLYVTLTQWSLNLDRTSCATAAQDSRHSPGSKKLNVW